MEIYFTILFSFPYFLKHIQVNIYTILSIKRIKIFYFIHTLKEQKYFGLRTGGEGFKIKRWGNCLRSTHMATHDNMCGDVC